MSPAATLTDQPALTLRRLTAGDLHGLRQPGPEQSSPPRRGRQLDTALRAGQAVGWVAEAEGRAVGFLVCVAARLTAPAGGPVRRLARYLRRLTRGDGLPPCVELFDLVVTSAWQPAVVEWALLGRLGLELRRSGNCRGVIVPEQRLHAQLFLREQEFRATRVLKGYYGDEDGYLMERRPAGD